jgi:DNA-binding transcriptional LysR family regulator
MRREDIADLTAFVIVAEARSFTRAAATLGLSQSTLSQILRRLEARLGARLLTRTTRSVTTTDAGERLVQALAPVLHNLDQQLADLCKFRDKPTGTIRIATVENAAKTVLRAALCRFLPNYPDVTVEVIVECGADVVADHYDAVIRLGEHVARDMIAVRVGPDIPMAIVGSARYFRQHRPPTIPDDLVEHRCINLRIPTSGTLNAWRLNAGGLETRLSVEGQIVFNTINLALDAALDGLGLAYLPLDHVEKFLKIGRLRRVLSESTPPLVGYHLYYPSRRRSSAALTLLVEALRYRLDIKS